jgi:ribosomal protein S27AE
VEPYSYENVRRVGYRDPEHGVATFVPVCSKCGRFVAADDAIPVSFDGFVPGRPNATCRRCGRTEMPFEGWL